MNYWKEVDEKKIIKINQIQRNFFSKITHWRFLSRSISWWSRPGFAVGDQPPKWTFSKLETICKVLKFGK